MPRLFVAILPPPTVRAELAALAEPLPGLRWVPADNIHLTLRFVGDAGDDVADRMADALAAVRVEPFILPVAGVGVFPGRGPARVAWAGLGRAHTRLFQLRQQVDEALLRVAPGIDVHRFDPHITVARLLPEADPKPLARWLERHAAFEGPPFRVAAFHLMTSALAPGSPPRYAPRRTFPLRAG